MFQGAKNLMNSVKNKPEQFTKALIHGNENLPFAFRQFLSKVGKQKITSLQIIRNPVSSAITKLMNLVSKTDILKKVKESPYDALYHLKLRINNKYDLEKMDSLSFANKKNFPDPEVMNIDLPSNFNMTIEEFVNKTISAVGMKRIILYRAKQFNCQVFVMDLLTSNHLNNNEYSSFIKQPTDYLVFHGQNPIFKKLLNTVTDAGERFQTIRNGLGLEEENKISNKSMANHSWINHCKEYAKQNNCSYRQAMKEAKATYKSGKGLCHSNDRVAPEPVVAERIPRVLPVGHPSSVSHRLRAVRTTAEVVGERSFYNENGERQWTTVVPHAEVVRGEVGFRMENPRRFFGNRN